MRRLALVVTLAFLASCGGGSTSAADRRRAQIETAARRAGLSRPVRDLLGDAAAASGATFQVAYDLGDGGVATVTQDPPDRRVDVRADQDGSEVTDTTLVRDGRTYRCHRARGEWTCDLASRDETAPLAVGPLDDDALRGAISQLRGRTDVRVQERTVASTAARCLVVAGGTLCISGDGVPLLVETPTSSLRAVRYRTKAPPGTFDLPASVSDR